MKYTEVQQMRKQAAAPISTQLWGGQAIHDAVRSGVMPERMQTPVPGPDGKAPDPRTLGWKPGLRVDDKPRMGYPAGQAQPGKPGLIDRFRANWNRVFTKGPFGLPAQRMMPKGMSDNMKDGYLKNLVRKLENTSITWM
jgi:hypothetical protein